MDDIMEIFVENPEKEFHVRELAKLTDSSPTTVSKHCHNLKRKGLLLSRKMSNHLLFRANTDNVNFKSFKREYNLRKLVASGLVEFLEEELNNPEAIILFGSFAKGEDIPASDIDIFVVAPTKKTVRTDNFEKKLKHKIQLFLHSRKEIETMKAKNKELLNNLVNGTVVYGFWEAF